MEAGVEGFLTALVGTACISGSGLLASGVAPALKLIYAQTIHADNQHARHIT